MSGRKYSWNKHFGWTQKGKEFKGRRYEYLVKRKDRATRDSADKWLDRAAVSVNENGSAFLGLFKNNPKLRYCTTKALNCVQLQASTIPLTFRANSIFDPDASLGPQQTSADGYAEMSYAYNNYMVKAAKITVTYTATAPPPTEAGHVLNNQCMLYLNLRADLQQPATAEAAMTNGNCYYKIFQMPGMGTFTHTLTGWYHPARLFGSQADAKTADWNEFGAAMNANPQQQANWVIAVMTTDGSQFSIPLGAYARVEVDYYCIFKNPITRALGAPETAEAMIEEGQKLMQKAAQRMLDNGATLPDEVASYLGQDQDAEMPANPDEGDEDDEGPEGEPEEADLDSDAMLDSQVEEVACKLVKSMKQKLSKA